MIPFAFYCMQYSRMTAEDRAKAVVAYLPAIPPGIRAQVETVVTRGIKRAVNQQLTQLEVMAEKEQKWFAGRGKSAKGHDEAAVHFHDWWITKFRHLRTNNSPD
jgi:hypothetical protein